MAVGEAPVSDRLQQQAVIHVALNRVKASGAGLSDVIAEPAQFTGYHTSRAQQLQPTDAVYQRTLANITPVLTGQAPDPTGGATLYLNPTLQKANGDPIPKWANPANQTAAIGPHVFYSGEFPHPGHAAETGETGLSVANFYKATGLTPPGAAPAAPPAAESAPTASPLSVADFYAQSGLKPPQGSAPGPAPAGGPPAAPGKPAGPLQEMAAGAGEFLTGLPGQVAGAFGIGPQSLGGMAGQAISERDPNLIAAARKAGVTPQAFAAAAAAQGNPQGWFNTALGAIGLNPESVPATTPAQRIERAIGGGAASALIPGGEAAGPLAAAGKFAANALAGAAIGGGSQAATEVAPAPLKPLAGLAAGAALAATGHGLGALGGGAARAVGAGLDPFAAALSEGAAQRQAGAKLAASAKDVGAVRNALAGTEHELVPGSQPTTFQLTGDIGVGALERGAAAMNPAEFKGRAAEQNTARVQALNNLQSGGDPAALAKQVTGQFENIDATTQSAIDTAQAAAQERAAALGGAAPPADYGAALRGAITDAETAARARESGLWQAIDPDGTLTGNVKATTQAANEIARSLPVTAKPMAGEEAGIFDAAQGMPAIAPVSDLIALRSRVSTEMRNELLANGRSPAYARLSQLRGAIQNNLESTITDKIGSDNAAVAAGTMPAPQSAAARLQQVLDDARQSGEAVSIRGNSGGAVPVHPAGAPPGGPPVGGAEGAGTGRPGAAARAPGVPGAPTFDAAAAERLATATSATKERARTFGLQPVSAVTAKAGPSDIFRLPDGSVPGRFFHSGPNGYEHVQAALKAGGAAAQPVLEDYAASDLRRAAGTPDGTIDPIKFGRWRAANQEALRALPPETQARFADAASASKAVADAAVSRAEALKVFKAGALGRVIGMTDPEAVTRTVGTALRGANAVGDIRALAQAAKADPEAVQGLRQAIADHIAQTLISNTEAGTTGAAQISADKFQTFVKRNRAALAQAFTPAEVDSMEKIAQDIQRANRSSNALKLAGSNTTQDINATKMFGGAINHGSKTMLDLVGGTLGGIVGEHLHLPGVGELGGALALDKIQSLRAAGIDNVNKLLVQALLNPKVAADLLAKVPATVGATQSALNRLGAALARGTGASIGARQAQPQQPVRANPGGGTALSSSAIGAHIASAAFSPAPGSLNAFAGLG
jgi:hypothetical protein